ncbi:glycosyltransferase family 4 protein [Chloroflexia bacterium SDU3-3]|nr:glycosyltransferase family 4 protein [Chloroflexia bacterium SDU3-3]
MSRPLRILMIVFNPVGKGTYWRAFHFARHLARRGHRVTLLAMARTRRLGWASRQEEGVTIVESPDMLWGMLRSGWDVWDALWRCAWCSRQDFDLVHAFECRPTVLLPALLMQKIRRVPLVLDWGDWFGRGGSVEERQQPLVRALLRPIETFFEERFRTQADASAVICTTLRQKAEALGVPPERIARIRDGADTEGLRPLDRDASRAALGLPAHAPLLGFVGAIFWRDAQLMAQAFDRIHAARPDARLLLIGYVNMPIEQLVAAPQAVIRSGDLRYEALASHLAACDLCWLPLCDSGANRGRWPLKLFDYMAAGRPTVATAVGDVPEVMQAHDIGALAAPTPQALAEAALALLADPARRARQGQQARRAAEGAYTWQQRTDELEQIYAQAIAHHEQAREGARPHGRPEAAGYRPRRRDL